MSNNDFGSYADDLNARIDDEVERVMRFAYQKLLAALVRRTPVKTGWTRANWQITNEFNEKRLPRVRTPKLANRWKYKEPTWLLNNVPYSLDLEMGSSKRLPPGCMFVRSREDLPGFFREGIKKERAESLVVSQ